MWLLADLLVVAIYGAAMNYLMNAPKCHVCPLRAQHWLKGRHWCTKHFWEVMTGQLVVIESTTGDRLVTPDEADKALTEQRARNLFNQIFNAEEQLGVNPADLP